MTLVTLDLGSNIESEESLTQAIEKLSEIYAVKKISNVFKSVPVGMSNQPDFLNVSLVLETEDSIATVRGNLKSIEDQMGRNRSGPKYGPRNIDIDIVLYGDLVDAEQKVPHPQSQTELFVVVPMADLDPDGQHPETGETWSDSRRRLMGGRSGKDAGIVLECQAYELWLPAGLRPLFRD